MADFYPTGNVRLFYRSVGSRTDIIPTANVTQPDFSVLSGFELLNLNNGLYCFEHVFTKEGSYLIVFYENGLMTTIQHLEIKRNRNATGNGLINL